MKKLLKIGLPSLLLLAMLAYLGIMYATEHVLSYSAIRPTRITDLDVSRYLGDTLTPSKLGLTWLPFDIIVDDSIKLRGWFIQSESSPTLGTVFLLHGIASCKATMLPMAAELARRGFNCVLYDSRANGESGGLNCTFGYYEKKDLSAYIDSTSARIPGSKPYGVFGNSLGAAVAIQAMAEDPRLACGVIESPFASLRDVIHDYFARMFFLRFDAIPDRALTFTEKIAHFPVDSVQPAIAALRVTQPILVIHGLKDAHISSEYGKRVFDNLASPTKVWLPVAEGDHYNLAKIGGAPYKLRIVQFFKNHLH
jgi:uncharacterized protein